MVMYDQRLSSGQHWTEGDKQQLGKMGSIQGNLKIQNVVVGGRAIVS